MTPSGIAILREGARETAEVHRACRRCGGYADVGALVAKAQPAMKSYRSGYLALRPGEDAPLRGRFCKD